MKLTGSQWKRISAYIPEHIVEEIELDNYVASLKGERCRVKLKKQDGSFIEQDGEKLSEHYFITYPCEGAPSDKTRCLNHSSGYLVYLGKNRKSILELWSKIKDLNIHLEFDKLKESSDFNSFVEIVRGHK